MKYLFSLLLTGISMLTFAQHNEHHMMKMMEDLTPEQQGILQTKKMTLALDLSEVQQQKVLVLNTQQATERKKKIAKYKTQKESGKKSTSEEKFNRINTMLDTQIALQKEFKQILNEEQYKQWRKMKMHKMMKMQHKMHDKRSCTKNN